MQLVQPYFVTQSYLLQNAVIMGKDFNEILINDNILQAVKGFEMDKQPPVASRKISGTV